MRRFLIGGRSFEEGSPELQGVLPQAYEQKLRPQCQCKDPPVPMYIAQVDGQYLVKRMPLTGRDHEAGCSSFEPPYELSGLGPLIGNAIQIDAASGSSLLKLDFSLSKRGSRASAAQPSRPAESVRNEAKKLSLRALLHYLWDTGELTEWTALWSGKRGWGRVRASLVNAATQMNVRGAPLSDILFVPEAYHPEDKDGIAARRAATLAGAKASGSGPRKLMLAVAEVKDFDAARDGQKILVRHLPFPFMIEAGTWRLLNARYERDLELWRSSNEFHLIMIATFGISGAGIATVEEVALMVVNENWIPFESVEEQRLLEKLSGWRRKSVKGLRFNLAADQPIASVTLPQERSGPVAMYIVPAGASNDYEAALADLKESRPEMIPWVWRVAEGDMPRLP
ncbi:DUF1173 domain-containing protein (plasmid) [Rhizobium sp. YTUHZ045]|uniref:DUF1173 domain-containing protein n=1 Tax=Rhizobium TaxID=379 RepID=UPI0039F70288